MEKKEKEILKILNKDARTPVEEIAKKLDISKDEVSNKVEKLEEEGVIKRFMPVLDANKIGKTTTAVILVNISKGQYRVAEKKLSGYDEVKLVYGLTGEHDALVIGKFEDDQHLNRFINLMHRIPNIENTETSVVLEEVKEDFRLRFSRKSYWKTK